MESCTCQNQKQKQNQNNYTRPTAAATLKYEREKERETQNTFPKQKKIKGRRGNEKKYSPLYYQFLLTFICCGTCGDFFVLRATTQTYHLSLALSRVVFARFYSSTRSFFLSSLSKKDFGLSLIFCVQSGNVQRENIIERQSWCCDVSPRAFVKSFLFPKRLFCPLLFRERDAFWRARAEDEDGDSLSRD